MFVLTEWFEDCGWLFTREIKEKIANYELRM